MNSLTNGQHLVADFWDCPKNLLNNKEKIISILKLAAKESGAVVIGQKIFQFKSSGMTMIILFDDSHIIAHNNLKNKFLAIDIYTCGAKTDPKKSFVYLKKELQPKRIKFWLMKRGVA
ncbi:adenosylmethionine decarboxylase [Candidatus Azambacteria bacterium]|nr:adenosylmethionine decarboxylase [Candidatus Azambacteria bacterium]